MVEREIYREELVHANWFVWSVFCSEVVCYLVVFHLTRQQMHFPEPLNAIMNSNVGFIVVIAALSYLSVIVLRMMKMIVVVTDEQVCIQKPFSQIPPVYINSKDIKAVDQQSSSGFQVNQAAGNRVVYSVIGCKTITVTDASGKNIVIGTNRPDELISSIKSVMK